MTSTLTKNCSQMPDPNALFTVQRARPSMGTLCIIEAHGASDENAFEVKSAVEDAFQLLKRIEMLMHPVHGIDLSRINRSISHVIDVDAMTWRLLQLIKQIHNASDGVFDPCLPTHEGTMHDVELLPEHQLICHAPVMMDLGGIAKGFAIDLAIEHLQAAGCCGGLVNAGGDVRAFGIAQEIYINKGDEILRWSLQDQALAVSQYINRDRPSEHQGYYLRNSQTSPLYCHVAVSAPSAAVADALTKCVMWNSVDRNQQLCQTFNASIVVAE